MQKFIPEKNFKKNNDIKKLEYLLKKIFLEELKLILIHYTLLPNNKKIKKP